MPQGDYLESLLF
jgi:hypothetical protein